MTDSLSILLVGCGKMGSALLERWHEVFPNYRFDVIDPKAVPPHHDNITCHDTLDELPTYSHPSVIVFAVKPQQLEEILPAYKKRFGSAPLYISIAAGKTTAFFKKHLGTDIRIVRTMPSLPATIGKGVTVLYAAKALPRSDKETSTQLMQTASTVAEWVEDEALMDPATALSGSGPAYVFLFIEVLAKAGVAAGLTGDMARTLAFHTVRNSTIFAENQPESLEQLRKNVTSPGGTTEAALKILMKDDALEKLIEKAIQAAANRSRELSNP